MKDKMPCRACGNLTSYRDGDNWECLPSCLEIINLNHKQFGFNWPAGVIGKMLASTKPFMEKDEK